MSWWLIALFVVGGILATSRVLVAIDNLKAEVQRLHADTKLILERHLDEVVVGNRAIIDRIGKAEASIETEVYRCAPAQRYRTEPGDGPP